MVSIFNVAQPFPPTTVRRGLSAKCSHTLKKDNLTVHIGFNIDEHYKGLKQRKKLQQLTKSYRVVTLMRFMRYR